jgi:hypothetical protein
MLNRIVLCELVGDFIFSLSGMPMDPTACLVEISFIAFWHCRTKGDVVLAA